MKYLATTIMIAVALSFQAVPNAADAKSQAEWKAEYQRPSSIPFPEDNPYTKEKERLGEMLFFDPRLSGSNSISCASCHNPSFSWGDGLATGFGHGMTRLGRRTPTVWNLAWADLLMWDGRFASLEEQALGPMGAAVEMNQDLDAVVDELSAIPGYRTRFNVAFPGEGITLGNVTKAIATFERMLVTGVAAFDRWIAGDEGAISESAKRGFDLFNDKANCAACHSGWNFTDGSFLDVGLPDDDIGRGNVVSGVTVLQHAFKTPALRNVSLRGPYMHNGTVADLAAVIDHYNDGFVERPSLPSEMKRLGLSEEEKADPAAFLQTLTSHDEAARHPVLPRGNGHRDRQGRETAMEIRRYAMVVAALLISAAPAHAETYTVIQAGKKFDTKLITIKLGDSIEFVNQDKISHNVYSKTKGHEFDLEVQTPGASNIVTFDACGKVQVRCAIHPRMKLTVNVIEQ